MLISHTVQHVSLDIFSNLSHCSTVYITQFCRTALFIPHTFICLTVLSIPHFFTCLTVPFYPHSFTCLTVQSIQKSFTCLTVQSFPHTFTCLTVTSIPHSFTPLTVPSPTLLTVSPFHTYHRPSPDIRLFTPSLHTFIATIYLAANVSLLLRLYSLSFASSHLIISSLLFIPRSTHHSPVRFWTAILCCEPVRP